MNEAPSKLNPALIGGGFIAVFSSLPFINMGNCCCCMWVLFGGALAAVLYGKSVPPEMDFSGGDGAILGLLAGIFGALFASLLSYLMIGVLDVNPAQEILDTVLATGEDIPEELTEYIEDFENTDTMSPVFAMIGLFFGLIVNAVFGTVGGIIGASFVKRKRPQDTGYTSY